MRNSADSTKDLPTLALGLAGVVLGLAGMIGWVALDLPAAPLSAPLLASGLAGREAIPARVEQAAQARVIETYGNLPLSFEANRGQIDSRVKFLARGSGYALFLTPTEAVLALRQPKERGPAAGHPPAGKPARIARTRPTVLRMKLIGANPAPRVAGLDELPGTVNYFIGNDAAKWRTNIPTYAKVKYRTVYPGVDLVYYGTQRQLEYDFLVAPGADPGVITLAFEGADKLEVDARGDLVLQFKGGEVRQRRPLVYQEINGARREVAGRYVRKGERRVGFQVAAYDATRPLVIDPALEYSTYLGGSSDDVGRGIAVDAAGDAYVTGETASLDFPTVNPAQSALGGCCFFDAFVAKLNPAGSALVYATYLGGSSGDVGDGIAVDPAGNAYVIGFTASTDFPTVNPLQPAFGGGGAVIGGGDAFVAKLDPTGSALAYATYLGGSGDDVGNGIAVDAAGHAYVTGFTESSDFPTANPLQPALAGPSDVFVAKVSASGNSLIYSTYLGGSAGDGGVGIAVDAAGHAYVTGGTGSADFPTLNPLQPSFRGTRDAFVARLDPTGSALAYSTYLGGSRDDGGHGIAVDAAGHAYVTGGTHSTDFPATPGAFDTTFNGRDAFVAKLDPTGSALAYATYLGGSDSDGGSGIAVDGAGNAYVTGDTRSTDFPVVNPVQPAFGGGSLLGGDAFVAKLDPTGSALAYATYLGGSGGNEYGFGIAVDAAGNAYVTGSTDSTDFPTANPLQPAFGGGGALFGTDAFVAKISGNQPPVADAGPDQVASAGPGCSAAVTLDGTGSTDPDGDLLTFTWTGPFGTASGPTPTVSLPLGVHTITLTVDDGHGGTASDTVVVTVRDGTPPVLSGVPGPIVVEQAGLAGTAVAVPVPTATDNCSPVVVTSDAPAVFPLGATLVTFTATDLAGNTATATTTVTVADTTPPSIGTVIASPSVLWPPNHRMVSVTLTASVSDICDAAPACQIISVSSNEPVNGLGDGDTAPDWVITGNLTVNLRAERSGTGSGRVYTITVRCTDASGNSSTKTVAVAVPHDRRM